MKDRHGHLSPEELLRLVDGELPLLENGQATAHLAACWECRSSLRQLEQTITDFVDAYHRELDPQLPPTDGPRALLRARLAQPTEASGGFWDEFCKRVGAGMIWASAGAVLLLLAAGGIAIHRAITPALFQQKPEVGAEVAVPDARLTPGAVRMVSTQELCSATYSDDADAVPASTKQRVLQEYRVAGAQASGYQLDYLISPQLGGTEDISNIWPEPESSGDWNAKTKDALEARLHQLVCRGDLSLATAQHELATDWISAYKRYFHTERPGEPL